MQGKVNFKKLLVLIGLGIIFLILGNGVMSLTNPDEVFYTEIAKEMVKHKTWTTPYLFDEPIFEKPIFLYWLLRIGFILFGVTNFSARFFPAVFALLGAIAVYLLGIIGFKNEKKAFLCALIAMSSGLWIGLARTVFTDMIFSVFILLSLLSFFWGHVGKKNKSISILLFFIFSALAVLTKGPLGFLIPVLIIASYLIILRDLKYIFCGAFFGGILFFLLIALPWYLLMVKKYGNSFINEFFYNDHWRRVIEAEHRSNDRWYFYPLTSVGCMFPWTLYVAVAIYYFVKRLRKAAGPIYIFLACWICAVFLIFQPAHSKLVSYIFPFFPALSLMAGDFIYDEASKKTKLLFRVSLINFYIIVLFSVILLVGLNFVPAEYEDYIASKIPIYTFAGLILALSLIFGFLNFKGKLLKSVYILSFLIPLALSVVPFISKALEPYLSSKDASAYLLDNYKIDNTILCSKFFVRGVRFYTDKNVAVIDLGGKGFFSPHPIPYLNNETKVRDFLKRQDVTFCVFRNKSMTIANIKSILNEEFKFTLLKSMGDSFIVKIWRN